MPALQPEETAVHKGDYPLAGRIKAHQIIRQQRRTESAAAAAADQQIVRSRNQPGHRFHHLSVIPIAMVIFDACTGEKTRITFPGAGHSLSYIVDTETYSEAVSRFVDQCLQNNRRYVKQSLEAHKC